MADAMDVSSTATRDADGRTPLHHAAVAGDVESIAELLRGAIVTAADGAEWQPLHCAASAGHDGAVSLLLEAQADPNARTSSGTTALLHASGKGHVEVVKVLLAAKADPTAQDDASRTTPLHRAAAVGAADVLRVLCDALPRSALERRDKLGCTPFHVAVIEQQESSVMILAEAGCDVHCKNSEGELALDQVPARIREQLE